MGNSSIWACTEKGAFQAHRWEYTHLIHYYIALYPWKNLVDNVHQSYNSHRPHAPSICHLWSTPQLERRSFRASVPGAFGWKASCACVCYLVSCQSEVHTQTQSSITSEIPDNVTIFQLLAHPYWVFGFLDCKIGRINTCCVQAFPCLCLCHMTDPEMIFETLVVVCWQ